MGSKIPRIVERTTGAWNNESMQNKFKILDKSGDHKYFTIIPNYIVNHSTPYEQAIYLYLKRIAGENGTCWSSAKEISKKLGCSRNTVAKYKDRLVKRGWIEIVGKRGKTKPTDEYRIVDLWKLNTDHYSKKESSTTEQSKDSSTSDKKVQPVNLESSTGGHKEEHSKKEHTKKNIPTAQGAEDQKPVNEANLLIDLFKEVNPSWQILFKNTSQRAAIQRMIKTHGMEKIAQTIKSLKSTNGKPYAPTITTPIQLEQKLGSLIAWWHKEQSKRASTIGIAL